MEKWEIASQIRYALGLNDRAEDILVKLTETDLMTFAEMVQDSVGDLNDKGVAK